MLIATLAGAFPGLMLVLTGHAVVVLLVWALGLAARKSAPAARFACRVAQFGLGAVVLMALPLTVIVLAAIGCPPDAHECPV